MSPPRNPFPTVDVIIEIKATASAEGSGDGRARLIVLIERKNEPPGWAIPGGFVDYGETLEDAARREALEETGLSVTLTDLLGVYSDPGRDPRHHTVSAVYIATAEGEPLGQDDAARAVICDPARPPGPLAFDHAEILEDYLRFKATGERPRPR